MAAAGARWMCIVGVLLLAGSACGPVDAAELPRPMSWFLGSSAAGVAGQPKHCGPGNLTIETPGCTVIANKAGYELRQYPDLELWALTTVSNASYQNAMRTGFYRCFDFISGKNSRQEKIEMTGPVRSHPEPESSGYSVGFFVPTKYQTLNEVPTPSNPLVRIVPLERKRRAVYGPFGGFPGESTYEKHAAELTALLDRDGVQYDPASVVYAGYSSPFRILNRKQEVWVDVTSTVSQ